MAGKYRHCAVIVMEEVWSSDIMCGHKCEIKLTLRCLPNSYSSGNMENIGNQRGNRGHNGGECWADIWSHMINLHFPCLQFHDSSLGNVSEPKLLNLMLWFLTNEWSYFIHLKNNVPVWMPYIVHTQNIKLHSIVLGKIQSAIGQNNRIALRN